MIAGADACPATTTQSSGELRCELPIGHRIHRAGDVQWEDAPPPAALRALRERLELEEREDLARIQKATADLRAMRENFEQSMVVESPTPTIPEVPISVLEAHWNIAAATVVVVRHLLRLCQSASRFALLEVD